MPPRPLDFERHLGRGPDAEPPLTHPLDYHVEDIPLSVLAGYKRVAQVPNFGRMLPHGPVVPHGGLVVAGIRSDAM